MMVLRRSPVNRLALLIRKPGGKSVADALQAAQDNLASVRDQCLEAMDGKLAQIADGVARSRTEPTGQIATLYALGNDVLEVAGVFGMGDLGRAASSLCDLLERFDTHHTFSMPALQVHLHALQALRTLDPGRGEEAAAMLDGLREVVDTIGRAQAVDTATP